MLEADHSEPIDHGLLILLLSLRCHGVQAEVQPIRQRYGSSQIGIAEMLRCARDFGLKARATKAKWKDLARMPMPVIAASRDGTFLLINRVIDDKLVVLLPRSSRLETMARPDFESIWDRRVVLMTPRSALSRLLSRLARFRNTPEGTLHPAREAIPETGDGMVDHPTVQATDADQTPSRDPGLAALVMLLRVHGIAAEPGQIRHRCGTTTIGVTEMLRCAKELGLKARAATTQWERLANTPLPAIAPLRNGSFLIIGKVVEDKILIQHPLSPRPEA